MRHISLVLCILNNFIWVMNIASPKLWILLYCFVDFPPPRKHLTWLDSNSQLFLLDSVLHLSGAAFSYGLQGCPPMCGLGSATEVLLEFTHRIWNSFSFHLSQFSERILVAPKFFFRNCRFYIRVLAVQGGSSCSLC